LTSPRERALRLATGWRDDLNAELMQVRVSGEAARDRAQDLLSDLATVYLEELEGIDTTRSRKVAAARVENLKAAGVFVAVGAVRSTLRKGLERLLRIAFAVLA
jgi:hypothetical protein